MDVWQDKLLPTSLIKERTQNRYFRVKKGWKLKYTFFWQL